MPLQALRRRGRLLIIVVAALVVAAVLTTTTVGIARHITARFRTPALQVLSSRPDAVTGGDARIRVTVPPGVDTGEVTVRLGDRDVTSSLSVAVAGVDGSTGTGVLEGVVSGLPNGTSTLRASAPRATASTLVLTNHPATGPLLAGPHEQPFVCQTASFHLVGGQTLGAPLDHDCSIAPRVDYLYRSTGDRQFHPLRGAAVTKTSARPRDVATIRAPDGTTTPYVVRVETRTIDRGIAQVAMLADPVHPTRNLWNHKLIYTFGGGCDAGWYVQGTSTGGVISNRLLSHGYAVASNSLNVFAQNCNDLLATEAFAMTREQFIEDHGLPIYTMGVGCSGGSYQVHQIADNYPGLLDAILVGCSFADVGFDTGQKLFDARLLADYYRSYPRRLTATQEREVSGFGSLAAVQAMSGAANRLNPTSDFNPAVPRAVRYDPKTNPEGARSTIWDHTVNVYGRSPTTGAARRPIGNGGVQYGLKTFQAGRLTPQQFLDLNAGVGGLDVDLNPTRTRTVADPDAVVAAYSTGRVLNGGGGLGQLPIIDFRSYTESSTSTDIHMRYHTFVTQARLVAANGDADNEVLLTVDAKASFDLERGQLASAFDSLDEWILAVQRSGQTGHAAVVRSKPADLVDACWTAAGDKIAEKQTYDGPGRCNRLYPSHASPRLVAGEPLTADVVSCRLKPVDPTSYRQRLTPGQLTRLRRIFPTGVCDWSKPGVGQQRPKATWLFFPG